MVNIKHTNNNPFVIVPKKKCDVIYHRDSKSWLFQHEVQFLWSIAVLWVLFIMLASVIWKARNECSFGTTRFFHSSFLAFTLSLAKSWKNVTDCHANIPPKCCIYSFMVKDLGNLPITTPAVSQVQGFLFPQQQNIFARIQSKIKSRPD